MPDDEKWLNEVLADVLLWEVSQLEQKQYIKAIGDFGMACMVKVYLEENGYTVELQPFGNYSQIVINR